MNKATTLIPVEHIEQRIFIVRGNRVIIDSDLAALYGVTTKRLNEQVKRNSERFPPDFMFQLTHEEVSSLRSQFATSNRRGGRRYSPFVFTEHGAIMAASVLSSQVAIEVSIYVVRAFIALREYAVTHQDLSRRIDQMEEKYDQQFKAIFDTVRRLIETPPKVIPKIGFNR